jgi:NTE family protein
VLRRLVAGARLTNDFDELPIPFRAVATDMMAGEGVVLDSGDLAVAMRASMAVPGAFAPIVVDDRVLSDGGMMRNLPVDVARQLCGEVIIAVSLASPPPERQALLSGLALATRSLDVMIDANQKEQIATLADGDVSIVVQMGDIGSADFQRVPEAIPLGRAAAEAQAALLSRYSVPEPEYLAWRSEVNREAAPPVRFAEVRITGLERVNPEYVRANLQNAVPDAELTSDEVGEDAGRLYALGDFEKVEYRVIGDPSARVLEIEATEKSWGPDFVRFDLGLAASGGGDVLFALRGDHVRTWLNSRGGQWHNAVQIGQASLFETSLYQPLHVTQRFFVEPIARFQRDLEDVFIDSDRVARYDLREAFGQLDAGVNLSTRAQLRAGLRHGWSSAEVETGAVDLPEVDTVEETILVLNAIYDTRDAVALPTRGSLLRASYMSSGSALGGTQSYDLAEGLILKSWPWRGDALQLFLVGGKELDGELVPYRQFELGGIRSFPGLERGELRGDEYWTAGTNYMWKLADIQSLFGQALYAGLRLQAGRMGERIDNVHDGTLYGASVSLGGRTPLGPVLISIGGVDNGSWEIQLSLGRPIDEGSIIDDVR